MKLENIFACFDTCTEVIQHSLSSDETSTELITRLFQAFNTLRIFSYNICASLLHNQYYKNDSAEGGGGARPFVAQNRKKQQ